MPDRLVIPLQLLDERVHVVFTSMTQLDAPALRVRIVPAHKQAGSVATNLIARVSEQEPGPVHSPCRKAKARARHIAPAALVGPSGAWSGAAAKLVAAAEHAQLSLFSHNDSNPKQKPQLRSIYSRVWFCRQNGKHAPSINRAIQYWPVQALARENLTHARCIQTRKSRCRLGGQ